MGGLFRFCVSQLPGLVDFFAAKANVCESGKIPVWNLGKLISMVAFRGSSCTVPVWNGPMIAAPGAKADAERMLPRLELVIDDCEFIMHTK